MESDVLILDLRRNLLLYIASFFSFISMAMVAVEKFITEYTTVH